MGILDMFDKIDDIVYKPVEALCNWVQEPLKSFSAKRETAAKQQTADIEKAARQQIADNEQRKITTMHNQQMALNKQNADIEENNKKLDIQLKKEEMANKNAALKEEAEINAEIRRWNAEIDQMINEQEDARRDRLVESIKRYQIDLANASRDIVNSIGVMSLELREKANNMVLEKTKEYKAIQDEAKKQSMIELKEAKDMFFEDDPDTYAMMRDNILEERRSMIDMAGRFIIELSEDIKRLNANTDELMKMGMNNVSAYLKPMANALGTNNVIAYEDVKKLEDNSVI